MFPSNCFYIRLALAWLAFPEQLWLGQPVAHMALSSSCPYFPCKWEWKYSDSSSVSPFYDPGGAFITTVDVATRGVGSSPMVVVFGPPMQCRNCLDVRTSPIATCHSRWEASHGCSAGGVGSDDYIGPRYATTLICFIMSILAHSLIRSAFPVPTVGSVNRDGNHNSGRIHCGNNSMGANALYGGSQVFNGQVQFGCLNIVILGKDRYAALRVRDGVGNPNERKRVTARQVCRFKAGGKGVAVVYTGDRRF